MRDFIHVDRPCGAFAYVSTREEDEEKRQMNVYSITWSCVERQEVRLVKINHSHKFKTYAEASSEAIYWFCKPRDRLAAGPIILFIVESSCKINKEGKYTQKLSSVVVLPPAPCESVESEQETSGDYRTMREERDVCAKKIEMSYSTLIKRRSVLGETDEGWERKKNRFVKSVLIVERKKKTILQLIFQ